MAGVRDIAASLLGPSDSGRIVPPTGLIAYLTVFTAAAMAFLAVFALALSFTSARVAKLWASELAQASTIRISAPPEQIATQVDRALEILRETPGVATARALAEEELENLLEPWFGPGLPIEELPIPRLIEITENRDGFDPEGLRLRLSAEVPGAILDDHTRWRRPLATAASRLRWLGGTAVALIGLSVAALIALAASASLSANSQVIAVLRLVGAEDTYVARAFVRRFTLRALIGGLAGTALAMILIALVGTRDAPETFLSSYGFAGSEWLAPLLVPLITAAVAFGATYVSALRKLREFP